MTRINIITSDSVSEKLLELFVGALSDYEIGSPADMVLLDAAEMARIGEFPEAKVVVFTGTVNTNYPGAARALGAEGFWYLTSDSSDLATVLDRIAAGERVWPEAIPVARLGKALTSDFSRRELQVLSLVAAGETDEIIAQTLFISPRTVKQHIKAMREKTGFRNRTELAAKACAIGLVVPK